MSSENLIKNKNIQIALIAVLCLIGVVLRFYNITENEFMYYDEGLYLNHNRALLELIDKYYPDNFSDFKQVLRLWSKGSLAMTKVAWVMVSDMRVFWGGYKDWFYPRLVSAIMGTLTLVMTFLFAKRYFSSSAVGFLSLIFLALLPSHVCYSRLALQEAFCTFFVLCGFYLYLFPNRLNLRTFLSGICFAIAFFSNYRLIIIPILVFFCEVYTSLTHSERINIRRYIWCTLTFLCLVIFIGNLDKGQNAKAVFGWMFMQANAAKGKFDILNLLSYPYYIFRMESPFFGLMFFGSIFYFIKRRWSHLFPFFLAVLYMAIYSFAEEKGLRYLCVISPFIAVSCASVAVYINYAYKSFLVKATTGICVVLAIITLMANSFEIAQFRTDYQSSIRYLEDIDPDLKVLSTQDIVQNIYTDTGRVRRCPRDYFTLLSYYSRGYKYLIIDPQVYISWTEDERKFNTKLIKYLDLIVTYVDPIAAFPHYNYHMLERFVFEHNRNLKESVAFLYRTDDDYGVLRIYDIKQCIAMIEKLGEFPKLNKRKR